MNSDRCSIAINLKDTYLQLKNFVEYTLIIRDHAEVGPLSMHEVAAFRSRGFKVVEVDGDGQARQSKKKTLAPDIDFNVFGERKESMFHLHTTLYSLKADLDLMPIVDSARAEILKLIAAVKLTIELVRGDFTTKAYEGLNMIVRTHLGLGNSVQYLAGKRARSVLSDYQGVFRELMGDEFIVLACRLVEEKQDSTSRKQVRLI